MTEQEFSQLVSAHKSTIYTVCYMFSKDEDEVNDLFQEVLINLWRGIDTFKGEAKLNSWIYRISLNTCISAERKKKRQPQTERLDMSINLYEDNDTDSDKYKCSTNGCTNCAPSTAPWCCCGSRDCPTTRLAPLRA